MTTRIQQLNYLRPIEDYLHNGKTRINSNYLGPPNRINANAIAYPNFINNTQENLNILNVGNTTNQALLLSNGTLYTAVQQYDQPSNMIFSGLQPTVSPNEQQSLYQNQLPSIREGQFQQIDISTTANERNCSFMLLPTISSTVSQSSPTTNVSMLPVFHPNSQNSAQAELLTSQLDQLAPHQLNTQTHYIASQPNLIPRLSYSLPGTKTIGLNAKSSLAGNNNINVSIQNNIPRYHSENSNGNRIDSKSSSRFSTDADISNLSISSIVNKTPTLVAAKVRSNGTLTPISTGKSSFSLNDSNNDRQFPGVSNKSCNETLSSTPISKEGNPLPMEKSRREICLLSPTSSENYNGCNKSTETTLLGKVSINTSKLLSTTELSDSDSSKSGIPSPNFDNSSDGNKNMGKRYTTKDKLLKELNENLKLRCSASDADYCCTLCTKQFRRAAWLKRHIVTHTTERPFKCVWCTSKHKRRDNLFKHMRLKHMDLLMSSIKSFYPLVEFGSNDKLQDLIKSGKLHKEDVKNVLLTLING